MCKLILGGAVFYTWFPLKKHLENLYISISYYQGTIRKKRVVYPNVSPDGALFERKKDL